LCKALRRIGAGGGNRTRRKTPKTKETKTTAHQYAHQNSGKPFDPALEAVINTWPELSEPLRDAVLAIIALNDKGPRDKRRGQGAPPASPSIEKQTASTSGSHKREHSTLTHRSALPGKDSKSQGEKR